MKRALLQLNAAVFLWGFTGVLGRAISIDSTMLVWWRMLITVVSLWALFKFQKKALRIPLKSVFMISLIGTILALHWVCFYASIKLANVTIALTCLSTTALLSAFLEPLILRKKFDLFEIFLGLFAIAGIIIIYNNHLEFSAGILTGLLAAILTVLVSVLNKKIVDDYKPEHITIYQLTGGFAGLTILLPVLLYFFPEKIEIPGTMDWIWLIVLSWVCTILTFYLYIRSLKKVSAFTINLALTLEPIYGIGLAFLIYKENRDLDGWFYVGLALILVAVVLHTLKVLRGNQQ